MSTPKSILLFLMSAFSIPIFAQDPVKRDSIPQKKIVEKKEEDNRNVMLNAANNTGPRDVNIGLPSTVGGITIQENDLPVVYFFWPELPNRTWRQSVSLAKTGLLKIGESVITTGDLGFAVNSYTKLGTPKFELAGNLSASHYGWLKGDVNVSGPLSNGWSYVAGIYQNYDPNSFDVQFSNYSDKTQIYRAGLTKRFKKDKGEISFLYKYAKSISLTNYAVFQYKENGQVQELDNFRIGRDSYIINDGTVKVKDILTGEFSYKNLGNNDAASTSQSFDVLGNYKLANGWKFNFSTRFRYAEATTLTTIPLSIFQTASGGGFSYQSTGEDYAGNVNSMLALSSPKVPTKTAMSRFEITKKVNNHDLRIGLTEYFYDVNKFTSSRSFYYQTVEANPRKLVRNTAGGSSNTDADGFYNYNVGGEYHNGYENKLSAYFSDKWEISNKLSLNYGLNLRYQKVKGDYYLTPRTSGFVFDQRQKTYIDNNWFHLGGSVNAVYKITDKLGLLADFTYAENNGRLESYSGAVVPNVDKTKSPLGAFGIYFNHDKFSVVSQATYLTRNNYQARLNLVNPGNGSDSQVATVNYDIQTVGWTTDIVTNPFKGFNLHYLVTFQNPIYKNYNFNAFGNSYSYDNKNVLEISKILMEIDPSYTYKNVKVWASFRYFSKQFANLTNALYFAARWETFGGVNYKINKHFDFGVTAVNFLNQTGAKGTINGAELITDASAYYNQLLVGSYIRPFTVEASLNFRF
ncbi:TonB-dependent receptor [Pedobacter sp. MR2016-19]|uniref:TonB-dependent receptor n=1 Tax=Pedobacter sp. MR2016-19 TaxID=2780089 RepID=UPI0018759ED4|nr:TonB-dependent receptor [Pedobacter sp. MR2016-19]MBE5319814.1 TonB-dependent receptor [Pedobacter sp. MR2016-19]